MPTTGERLTSLPGKIVLVAKYFWPEKIGSAPYMADLAAWLVSQGHEVVVITARPHYPDTGDFAAWADGSRDRETVDGATVIRVPVNLSCSNGVIGRLRRDGRFAVGAMRLLARQLADRRETTLICLTPTMLALLMVEAVARYHRRVPTTVVAITHDIESGLAGRLGIAGSRLLIAPMRALERFALNLADHVFVLSDAMKRELIALGVRERAIQLMPIWAKSASPGDVPVAMPPAAPATPAAPVAISVLYSGSLGKKQGLEVLLDIARVMAADLPGARLRIQGEGPEKAMLIDGARSGGLTNIDFLPLASASELFGTLQAADIHVVPQASDIASYAVPSKLFNIMAAGKSVLAICEASTTVAEIVTRADAGICVSRDSAAGLRAALLALASDADRRRRHGESGQRYVRTVHDRQAIFTDFARHALNPQPSHVSG